MSRGTNVNQIMSGAEPKIIGQLTKLQLVETLNWYNQNKDDKDAHKFASEFLKKKYKINIGNADVPTTFGYCCRIVSNGGILPDMNQGYFENHVNNLKNRNVEVDVVDSPKKVVDIQARLRDKVNDIAGELEGAIDDYKLSNYKKHASPLAIMKDRVKGLHASRIIEIFKSRRNEFNEAMTSDDEQIKEGYSNFNKSQLKKMIAFCDQIILDASTLASESVKTRKPRKRKAKTPEQLVSKMKYLNTHEKLESIDPKSIIGANSLWIFNVKTRKLGCYYAEDVMGLSVKGSSIINYDVARSVHKTVRKPETVLPEVLKGGKVVLRNLISNIKAVESKMNGRIGKDIVLLRVSK